MLLATHRPVATVAAAYATVHAAALTHARRGTSWADILQKLNFIIILLSSSVLNVNVIML